MNANDLLNLLNHVPDSYLLEAADWKPQPRSIRKRPMVLVAVIAALMLLLAGCVAVYLRLQDMSIAQETYTQEIDSQGRLVEPAEKVRDILTLYGHSGSPVQQAAREWYEFTKTYDPGQLTNDPDLPDIPNNYEYIYNCWNQTMMDKLDEIVSKYDLKLLEERFPVQSWSTDIAIEGMGLSSLYRPEAGVKEQPVQGMLHSPGNFRLYIGFTLTGEDALWTTPVSGTMRYSRKDYFPEPLYASFEEEAFQQWDYTAADGTKLLLALSNTGYGYIVADLPDATIDITLSISLNHQMYEGTKAPTREVLEQMADVFDYAIQPQITDPASLREALAAADEAELAQENYEAPSYDGFDAFMEEAAVHMRKRHYAFWDIDGNGQEDMLIGNGAGYFDSVLLRLGDTVQAHGIHGFQLLENGNLSTHISLENLEEMGRDGAFFIYAPYSDTQLLGFNEDGTSLIPGEPLWQFQNQDGNWVCWDMREVINLEDGPKISVDIQQILEENPVVQMQWHPCLDYPLSDGRTLAQYLKDIDIPLPEEELMAQYAAWAAEIGYSDYCLRDINGDGVTDLLVGDDSMADLDPVSNTYYWSALTWRYGQLMSLNAHDFYLCQDGILEYYNWGLTILTPDSPATRKEHHKFFRLEDSEQVVLDYVIYCRATDSWVSGWDESPLSKEEAEAILAKYPRIDQGMKPIEELIGQ